MNSCASQHLDLAAPVQSSADLIAPTQSSADLPASVPDPSGARLENTRVLDHAGIAARVPHSGSMCLLHALRRRTPQGLECTAVSHRDPTNPLRTQGQLLAVNAIEYAAQAMALHGSLSAGAGVAPVPGFLASVRGVRLLVPRLDDVAGALVVAVTRVAGDATQARYHFSLHDERGQLLADGRATVVLGARPRPSP